ncbi:MAG: hypothetical protein M1829_000424 [Trizodia sp. TS-e1964]|nr:MAG: hypothetical protein M1829_000424 [Trizodia sp. TS-e1964]
MRTTRRKPAKSMRGIQSGNPMGPKKRAAKPALAKGEGPTNENGAGYLSETHDLKLKETPEDLPTTVSRKGKDTKLAAEMKPSKSGFKRKTVPFEEDGEEDVDGEFSEYGMNKLAVERSQGSDKIKYEPFDQYNDEVDTTIPVAKKPKLGNDSTVAVVIDSSLAMVKGSGATIEQLALKEKKPRRSKKTVNTEFVRRSTRSTTKKEAEELKEMNAKVDNNENAAEDLRALTKATKIRASKKLVKSNIENESIDGEYDGEELSGKAKPAVALASTKYKRGRRQN